ncbi:MAG TPA: glucokinase [Luteimonas sp.]|nr:glucokinase [Luteimonas sp.]
MSGDRILLADIGGTNARFALADPAAPMPLLDDSIRRYAVAGFGSLAEAAQHYLAATSVRPARGVFAVAGRVDGDIARMTNHPWVISHERVRNALGLQALQLVNDFVAQAMAVRLLREEDVVAIGAPGWAAPTGGPRSCAVLGPGTGLGVGALLARDGRHYALATEGGHASFAPGTPEEVSILERLSAYYGRVSNERVVSGGGLVNLHRALSEIAGLDPGPLQPADITARAAQGDRRCMRAIDVFCAVFGAIAGDLVLTLGAWDGVFLSGGMVPRLLPELQHSGFRQRFEGKGRYAPAMAHVPTFAVVHPQPGLLGAAALAADQTTAGGG